MSISKALTIAGSDSGGGAGIQADLKTFQELHVFGMTAITAITAQNTQGVHAVHPVLVDTIEAQLHAIATDLGPHAVKTGMLFSSDIIELVARTVRTYAWEKLVVDPVMIAKGGAPLLQAEAMDALKNVLLPHAYVVTPNIPEAEWITGLTIETMEDRQAAARYLHELGAKHVVVKGGHGSGEELVDLLFDGKEYYYFSNQRVDTLHTHGTGCTFAAAITAELAKGASVVAAVKVAQQFVQAAVRYSLGLGSGHGPTNHWAYNDGVRV